MSVTAVNSNASIYQIDLPTNAKQIKTDFQNLTAALQSGDMASAQQAFAALRKDDPQVAKALAQTGKSSNPQVNALQSLASALKSDDVPAAQAAMTSLQQALKGHRGHHHGAPAAATPPTNTVAANGTDSDNDNDGSTGSNLSAIA
jgi:thioredoxin-like negative regulator of GroEL